MNQSKHIVFISSWYPVNANPTHGIFNFYFAQAVALRNRVSVLHVGSRQQNQAVEMEENTEEGIYTLRVFYKKPALSFPLIAQWLKWRRLKRAYSAGYGQLVSKCGPPQLVQLNVAMPAGVGVMHLAQQHNWPYVLNENWSGYCKEDGNYKGLFLKYFTRKIVAGAKVIMPTSAFLKEAMLRQGLRGRYEIVPNVVNVRRFVPSLQKPQGPNIRFIHISSLTDREKNVSGLLRAFSEAWLQNPNMELHIAGDGPEKEAQQSLASRLPASGNIHFKGRLQSDALVNEINQSHCLLMFSHFETFCLVIMEAFACGVPVITSKAGAIPSYMNTELGLQVSPGNEKELTQAILQFADHPHYFNGGVIRNFVSGYCSYEKVSEQLDTIYNSVLSGPSATTSF